MVQNRNGFHLQATPSGPINGSVGDTPVALPILFWSWETWTGVFETRPVNLAGKPPPPLSPLLRNRLRSAKKRFCIEGKKLPRAGLSGLALTGLDETWYIPMAYEMGLLAIEQLLKNAGHYRDDYEEGSPTKTGGRVGEALELEERFLRLSINACS